MATDNTNRFSNRVEDYVKYRPGYPDAIIPWLEQEHGLSPEKIIADIGAGTGISSAIFLKKGYTVYAIEPNKEMRTRALSLLEHFSRFHAVEGTAENTHLPDNSMDTIIVGQAFHWFAPEPTKTEFRRILRHKGNVVLLWNERLTTSSFEQEYDQLIIRHGKDYVQVHHRNISLEHITAFFSPHPVVLKTLANKQVFDFEGLLGRLLSSSYMPTIEDAGYEAMVTDLHALFDRNQERDVIQINYVTKVFSGIL